MGCQSAIAEQILAREGDYLLVLKANHPTAYAARLHALALVVGRVLVPVEGRRVINPPRSSPRKAPSRPAGLPPSQPGSRVSSPIPSRLSGISPGSPASAGPCLPGIPP